MASDRTSLSVTIFPRLFEPGEPVELCVVGVWYPGVVVTIRLTSYGLYYGVECRGFGGTVEAGAVRPASINQPVRITGWRLTADGVFWERRVAGSPVAVEPGISLSLRPANDQC
jgi:hypothetical protein